MTYYFVSDCGSSLLHFLDAMTTGYKNIGELIRDIGSREFCEITRKRLVKINNDNFIGNSLHAVTHVRTIESWIQEISENFRTVARSCAEALNQ